MYVLTLLLPGVQKCWLIAVHAMEINETVVAWLCTLCSVQSNSLDLANCLQTLDYLPSWITLSRFSYYSSLVLSRSHYPYLRIFVFGSPDTLVLIMTIKHSFVKVSSLHVSLLLICLCR